MEPLISVIVPVYNVEKYLEQCVESIRNQSYTNLEIILVDDGSPDNCPVMCDRFAEVDERIRVMHKENGGLSDARNAGIGQATGQYIVFVDSDDWIHQDMISILCQALVENGADISTCEYQKVNEDTKLSFNEKKVDLKYIVYNKKEAMEKWLYQKMKGMVWAMLIPKQLCESTLFPKGRLYEDNFVIYKYFWNAHRIVYISNPLYYYRNNPNGSMNRSFTFQMLDEVDGIDEIIDFLSINSSDLLKAAKSRKYSAHCRVIRHMPLENNNSKMHKIGMDLWAFLKNYRWEMMFDFKARLKNRIAAACTIMGYKIFRFV